MALPIFALGTVLFPDGLLPLRVFEARYMDMVRRAMRDASGFGVCLIRKGREAGDRQVEIETVGCRARIDSWNMEQLGVLQISTTGTERFRIVSRETMPDGLIVAETTPLETEEAVAVPAEATSCQALLQRIVQRFDDDVQDRPIGTGSADASSPIAKPYRFDDATWLGNRLCELLPIPVSAKQKLMELTDAPTRLEVVRQYLEQHGVR